MIKSILFALSGSARARRCVTRFGPARRFSRRFVAGETMDDAMAACRALNARGLLATLDHLGENVTTESEATACGGEILTLLDKICDAGVLSHVSIKLTQMGLAISPKLCEKQVEQILKKARSNGNFVRIDMEGSAYTEPTLQLFYRLRFLYPNVGTVIQSMLRRSESDAQKLVQLGAKVRLVKGAYLEPADIAFPRKRDVDANYIRLMEMLLSEDAIKRGGYPAIATHDPKMVRHAKRLAKDMNIPRDAFEFQMLYGIRRDLQDALVKEGFKVRVYVPYGDAWYPYFMRRLAERPANLFFILRQIFRV
ncbi:MAG: proline dehydrogenase family protein [bacterium]